MNIFDKLAKEFSKTDSEGIGQAIEELVSDALTRRRSHERRWFDNNFFDDGYHFRMVSKKTGKVIDHAYQNSSYVERSIPRASRQIRGVTNLLFAAEPYPVVYPERITIENFRDPRTGQINEQAYNQAKEQSKEVARKQGIWLTTEWEDEQQLPIKLIDMMLLAAKTSVAWIQVYSDAEKQKICTDLYDGFDVVVYGDRREATQLPFMTKTCPMDIHEVMRNPMFDPKMLEKISPDNKYATSEIKDAYMRARYGVKMGDEKSGTGTVIVKESFLKEVLNDENWKDAIKKGEDNGAMEGKSRGDGIMRHPYTAGGITLLDEYVDYDEYPLVDFRFEPGPLYQVPFIERFIPQNKSLDVIVTRLEKWVNAMVVGVYQKRKGENFQVSNFPGGQMVEYETTPLEQMQNGSVGNTPFNVIELLNKYIDEQGATTSAGVNVPSGVKSGVAIESVKSTEYANLKISTMMLKQTIKNIADRMLERADKDYLEPKEVSSIEDGEPNYFDVIGQRGLDLSKKVNKPLPEGIIPLSKKTKVRIEIEPGLGLTMDGKREAMQQIINTMMEYAKEGYVTQESLQMVIKRFLETFGYGNTQEFMEALDEGTTKEEMSQDQITQMQIALLTALKDAGAVGPAADQKMVDSTKVGVLESFKESGLMDKLNKPDEPEAPKPLAESLNISFKDLPEDTKADVIQLIGLPRPKMVSPVGTEQAKTHVETVKTAQTPIVDPLKEREVGIKEKAISQKPVKKASSGNK